MTCNSLKRISAIVLFGISCISSQSILADCSAATTLSNVPLFFYDHSLGNYTIYLSPTLTAIETGQAGSDAPYFQKPWEGDCPAGLSASNSCTEYTIYPNYPGYENPTNFSPNIAPAIEKWTDGKPNRGEVRILTNASQTKYVYTTDHEKTFCGPYSMPN